MVINSAGQLGTAPAGSARTATARAQAAGAGLARTVRRQAAPLRAQAAQLRAQATSLTGLKATVGAQATQVRTLIALVRGSGH